MVRTTVWLHTPIGERVLVRPLGVTPTLTLTLSRYLGTIGGAVVGALVLYAAICWLQRRRLRRSQPRSQLSAVQLSGTAPLTMHSGARPIVRVGLPVGTTIISTPPSPPHQISPSHRPPLSHSTSFAFADGHDHNHGLHLAQVYRCYLLRCTTSR